MLRKLLYSLLVIWGIISLVFLLFNVLPDDPARLTLGQRTDAESIANVRRQLHLDQPVGKRYLLYINDLMPIGVYPTADTPYQFASKRILRLGSQNLLLKTPYLGQSYQSKKPVWDILAEALPGTVVLALSALLIGTVGGIALGVIAALRRGSWVDTSSILASIIGISTPSFFAGLIIAYVFGHLLAQYTGLSMVGSMYSYDINGVARLSLSHLILPAITLGIRPLAIIAQLTRSSMLDVLSLDYIRTGYAKGLKKRQIVWRHALPNALNPVVTAVSGWLAELLAGSFFVEYIFSWKGVGKLTVESLDKFDFPVVMGAILVSATIFVIVNLLTDLLYRILDPRIS